MVDFVYPNKVTLVMGKGRRKCIGDLQKLGQTDIEAIFRLA
jgi:hypothetical protein